MTGTGLGTLQTVFPRYETLYDGWGGWRWRWGGFGDTTTFVNDYKVGTLFIVTPPGTCG